MIGVREGHALSPSGCQLNAASILLHTEGATKTVAAIAGG
jgi:hypothetical protein